MEKLVSLCKTGIFELSQAIACELNALVAKRKSLQEGIFRTGSVSSAGTTMKPPAAEEKLILLFEQLIQASLLLENPLERGIAIFPSCAQHQFFLGGNNEQVAS